MILLDQISKIYIKLNFPLTLYGDDAILDYGFFKLLFIENKGMAWGTKLSDFIPFLDDEISKLLLSILRIVAIFFLGYWIKKSLQEPIIRTGHRFDKRNFTHVKDMCKAYLRAVQYCEFGELYFSWIYFYLVHSLSNSQEKT